MKLGVNEYDTLVLVAVRSAGCIIGRGVWADSRLMALPHPSPHILRLRPTSECSSPGYVYAFQCLTDAGYQLLAENQRQAGSIPFLPLDAVLLEVKIPTTSFAATAAGN